MKVYSPSQTKLFLECEYKWYLERKQGYKSRYVEKRDVAAALGSAYGAAWAHYFQTGRVMTTEEVTQAAISHYQEELAKLTSNREMLAEDKAQEYESLIPKMIQRTMDSDDFIPTSWSVTAVEGLVDDGAGSRIDLGGKDQNGRPWFWDNKVKTFVKTSDVDYAFTRYFDKDWQMMHYAWAYSQMIGELVNTYYIGMMVVSPTTRFYVRPFTVTETDVVNWLESACVVWGRMEEAEKRLGALTENGNPRAITPMSNNHYGNFGKCSHYGLCFDGGDHSQYIKIERTNK